MIQSQESIIYRLMSWIVVCLSVTIIILAGSDSQIFPLVFLAGKPALGNALLLFCFYLFFLRPMFKRADVNERVGHGLLFLLSAWGVSLPFLLTMAFVDNGQPISAFQATASAWVMIGTFWLLSDGFYRLLRGGYYPVIVLWTVGIPLAEYFLREIFQPTKEWGWWFYTPFGRIAADFYGAENGVNSLPVYIVFFITGGIAWALSEKIGAGSIQEKHSISGKIS